MVSKQVKLGELIITENMYKIIFVIALPLVITNIIQVLYEFIDMFYFGNLGAMALVARAY
ncbi:hypothetical protein CR532_02480 [Candidatus Borreliella tachyglossi]|uniref:MATE family efflux transporter n=1 Tax=Candidatus Borreliella tachyglossi TaxID=1964448 RepID=A0A2S1LX21_9SPIR|nr:hypothetical protein CR532_02480 [Candidatus Borreliella tachyglossi]